MDLAVWIKRFWLIWFDSGRGVTCMPQWMHTTICIYCLTNSATRNRCQLQLVLSRTMSTSWKYLIRRWLLASCPMLTDFKSAYITPLLKILTQICRWTRTSRDLGSRWPSGKTLASDACSPGSNPERRTLERGTGYYPVGVGEMCCN